MSSLRAFTLLAISISASVAAISACVGDSSTTADTTSGNDGGNVDQKDGSTTPVGTDSGGPVGTDSGSPGADSGSDAGQPPLDVRTLPGLRLWLESTKGLTKAAVGTDIVSWVDSSGRWLDGGAGAPDGGPHTAYPVPYNGGGAVYPGVVANGINGRPVVTFETGPKLAVANHDDFNPGTGDFLMAAVGLINSGAGPFWRLVTATTAPSGTLFASDDFCSFLGAMGAPPKCTSPDYTPNTSPHVFVVRRKVAQALFRVDATTRATYDFGATPTDLGVQTFQQANAFIGGGFVGQVAELVIIIGSTTDADADKLEAHLKTKYAIP